LSLATELNFRWLGFSLVLVLVLVCLSLTSMMNSAFAYGAPAVDSDPPIPFEVMGGSGLPTPSTELIDELQSLYFPSTALFPGQPTFPDVDPTALTTPEQFYPITGVNQLPLDTSVAEGAGDPVDIFGASQSAVIASLEMEQLEATDPTAPASFVLIGDLMNPNGGIFEQFDGLTIPSLGLDFYGATPADDFPTTITRSNMTATPTSRGTR
jgi:hypothetical protein